MGWPRGTNKYCAKKSELDGYSFASKLESSVYLILKNRAFVGEIEFLKTQDRVLLSDAEIAYIADFKCKCLRTGDLFWVEAKGIETDVWRIKRRLWMSYGPGRLEIWKGSYSKPRLHEELIPK